MCYSDLNFLERAADFNPRMPTGHDAEHTVFVAYILNDITRVLQWKIQLMACHRKDTPISSREQVVAAAEVGGACRRTQVVNHVFGRHDAQAGVEEHGRMENAFVISLSAFSVMPAEFNELFLVLPFLDVFFQLPQVECIVQKAVVLVP